jgi:hypothetical protein
MDSQAQRQVHLDANQYIQLDSRVILYRFEVKVPI